MIIDVLIVTVSILAAALFWAIVKINRIRDWIEVFVQEMERAYEEIEEQENE